MIALSLSDSRDQAPRAKSACPQARRTIAIAMLAPLALFALESCTPRANSRLWKKDNQRCPKDGTASCSRRLLWDIFSIEKLLNEGTDINARASNGTTALMGAAYAGYPRTTEYLILRGAQIDAQSTDGLTALHYAAGAGYTEIVGKLLDAGADPNAKSADGTTPLMRAARAGREETAKRLLAGGATAGPT